MRPSFNVPVVILLTALSGSSRATKVVPVLCTLEDANGIWVDEDPLMLALKLLQKEGQKVKVNRKFVRLEEVPDFVGEHLDGRNNMTETRWWECNALLVAAPCDIASMLIDWLTQVSFNGFDRPPILVFEPHFLPCQITTQSGVMQLSGARDTMEAIVSDLLQGHLRWRKMIFIHDSTIAPVHLSILRLALARCSILVQVLELGLLEKNGSLSLGLLAALTADVEHHVMLSLSKPGLSELLQKAKVMNLLHPSHFWVLFSPTSCASALGEPVSPDSNVLLLVMTHTLQGNMTEPLCKGHILDGAANMTTRTAHLLAAGIHALAHRVRYSATDKRVTSPCETSSRALLSGHIDITSEKLSVWTADGNVTFDLSSGRLDSFGFEVCSTDQFSPNGYSQVARWSSVKDMQTLGSPLYRNIFRDFSNSRDKLIVSTRTAAPFVMRSTKGNKTVYEGLCIDILDELAQRLHFNYTIVEVEDHKWGSRDENNNWNGVVGEVVREKAAIGVGPFSYMSERKEVVDFTEPFAEEGTTFMMIKPGDDKNAIFRLFRPFQPIAWLSLALMTLLFVLAIYTVEMTSPFYEQRRGVLECLWAVYGYAVGQGTAFDLSSNSARLVLGTFWVIIIIVTSTYTADLAAVLTVNTQKEPINTLGQLASQSEILPLIELGSNLETLFQSATSGIYKDIADMMKGMPKVTNSKDAKKLLEERNMAYLSDMSQIDYLVGEACDKFVRADSVFNTGGIGFIVPKGAQYLDAFNSIIVKLSEAGILDEWRRKWWSHEDVSCKPEARLGTGNNLGCIYLAGPLIVFAGTSSLGFLLAAAEWAWRTDRFQGLIARLYIQKGQSSRTQRHNMVTKRIEHQVGD